MSHKIYQGGPKDGRENYLLWQDRCREFGGDLPDCEATSGGVGDKEEDVLAILAICATKKTHF